MSDPLSLLPPNATASERAVERLIAGVSNIPAPIRDIWNADTCPMNLLPWLAWALSVDAWNADWTEAIKRSVVRNAIAIQRRKGTAESVRAVVAAFGGTIVLREWHQRTPPGPPHTFDVVLNLNDAEGEEVSARFVEDVVDEITRTKPVRSHFTVTQGLSARATLFIRGGAQATLYRRLDFQEAA